MVNLGQPTKQCVSGSYAMDSRVTWVCGVWGASSSRHLFFASCKNDLKIAPLVGSWLVPTPNLLN